MEIRIETKSVNSDHVEIVNTTLEEFFANDDGIDEAEATRINNELKTKGHSRVAGFVGIYADIYRAETLETLTAELQEWTAKENLPFISADELAAQVGRNGYNNMTETERRQYDWLIRFGDRWDEAQEREDKQQ